jgi:hypothetical protein
MDGVAGSVEAGRIGDSVTATGKFPVQAVKTKRKTNISIQRFMCPSYHQPDHVSTCKTFDYLCIDQE